MTLHRKLLPAAFGAIGLLLFACSKKSEEVLVADSGQSARIVSGAWFYQSAGIDVDRNGTIDNTLPAGTLPACALDNAYIFFSNGAGTANDSTLRCDTLPVLKPFTWAFANNEQSIDLNGASFFGFSGRFRVFSLNDTAFILARDTMVTLPMFPLPVTASIVINLNHR